VSFVWKDRAYHTCLSLRFSRPKKVQTRTQRPRKTHNIWDGTQSTDEADSSDGEYKLDKLGGYTSDPITASLLLNGKKLDMEVDTDAALSVISESTRQTLFADETLHPSNLVLKTYTNECMEVKRTIDMLVQYGDPKQNSY